MQGSDHSGHRERMRQEFSQGGFRDNTPQHKILEMLLFYSIPRKDTNIIAHRLIDRFGSISGVIDAPEDELMKIPDISFNTVTLLKLIIPVARVYVSDKCELPNKFNNIDDICNFLLGKYFGYNREVFAITTFSNNGRKLGYDILNEGSITSVSVSTRDIIEVALKRNASCVIMSHNHPEGIALPSKEDVEMTKMVQSALRLINVKLIDHIIIAGDDYVSMAQSRSYKYIFL